MRTGKASLLLLLLIASSLPAQTRSTRERRSASPRQSPSTGAVKDLAGVFRGTLKELTSKEIVIQNEENQTVSIRRNRKTKFWRDTREVKPVEIALNSSVTIEATQDIDLKPVALTVTASATP